MQQGIIVEIRKLIQKWISVTRELMKVMIPMLVLVQILEYLDVVVFLGWLLDPMMEMLGLPGAMGLVWATALLGNIPAALGVYILIAPMYELTAAQITGLMSVILMAHSVPVEQQIARRVGLRWLMNVVIRCGFGFLYGIVLYKIYGWLNILQGAPSYDLTSLLNVWTVESEVSIVGRFFAIIKIVGGSSLVILALLIFLRVLAWLGILSVIEKILGKALIPLGVSARFTSITSIGLILGISYGGGMIMEEVKDMKTHQFYDGVRDREIFLTMTLLGLVHGILDDTLMAMLVGAELSGVFWGRILFGIMTVSLIKFFIFKLSDRRFYQIFFVPRHRVPEASSS